MSSQNRRSSDVLVQKMFELEAAYREIGAKDKELSKYRKMSVDTRSEPPPGDNERDREITKLQYMLTKSEERLKVSKVETENAKRDLKNEQEGRKEIEKKVKALERENRDLRGKLSEIRVKLGVANANFNVGKHETDELRKNHQDNQIQIARLEERLNAANQELDRLRNPLNPDGSEEVKKKITTEKKQLNKLKSEVETLKELRVNDQQTIDEKTSENKLLQAEINVCRQTIENLETSLEMAETTIQDERASKETFEKKYTTLKEERENYDEQIRQFKVKLGITQASKNVNHRQAELLRKKDEEYQYTIQTLEKKLRTANAEIERLIAKEMKTGKTADSLQDHTGRLKKRRNNSNSNTAFITPRTSDTQRSVSGWSPARTPKEVRSSGDRISISSIASVISQTQNQSVNGIKSTNSTLNVKQGRVSAP